VPETQTPFLLDACDRMDGMASADLVSGGLAQAEVLDLAFLD